MRLTEKQRFELSMGLEEIKKQLETQLGRTVPGDTVTCEVTIKMTVGGTHVTTESQEWKEVVR